MLVKVNEFNNIKNVSLRYQSSSRIDLSAQLSSKTLNLTRIELLNDCLIALPVYLRSIFYLIFEKNVPPTIILFTWKEMIFKFSN